MSMDCEVWKSFTSCLSWVIDEQGNTEAGVITKSFSSESKFAVLQSVIGGEDDNRIFIQSLISECISGVPII